MQPAAIYARSSKDRNDVSIAAQVRALTELATSRGFEIVATFEDPVEDSKTEARPAFIALAGAIKNRKRGWSVLLVYDTARIARRRHIAQAFKYQAHKHGVLIQYKTIPADIDPISEILLQAVYEAFDEVHSLMSREKAIAGQRENLRRGWRAGGRAPVGYELERTATGAVREGKPVMKSRLAPSKKSAAVAAYLKARAHGLPRPAALKVSRLELPKNSLIDLEWNALTYAGHTVWNRHYGKGDRLGNSKRRPRNEWQVERNTHPALITDAEAEAILAGTTTDHGTLISHGKRAASEAILSGLLVAPDGRYWRSAGTHYRLEGKPSRYVRREKIERLIVEQIRRDLSSEGFLEKLIDAARRAGGADRTLEIRREIAKLRKERDRAARLALEEEGSAVWVALVAERSAQVQALDAELERVTKESELEATVRRLTPAAVREMIDAVEDPARLIQSLVERIELTPTLRARLHYRAAGRASRSVSVASPRDPGEYATAGPWFLVA